MLRAIHLITILDSPFFRILYIDPGWFDEWGIDVASGQLLAEGPFFLGPLYPYFLGLIYAIFGQHYEPVAVIQALFGATVPPLLFLAAKEAFGRPVARLGGILAVIYLPAVYFGGLMMKPGMTMFLVTLALWLASRALGGTAGRAVWLRIGIVMALACLTRGNMILTLPVIALWLLLRPDPEGPAWRPPDAGRWVQAGSFLFGSFVLVFSLTLAHNVYVSGEWILTTSNAGANFYIGNNPSNDSGEYQQLPFIHANPKYEQRDFKSEAERRSGRTLTEKEVSRFWFTESWRWIRSEPTDWVGLLWRKVRVFWNAYEIPDSLDYYLYRTTAPVLRLPIPGFGLLAPLGLTGMLLAWRRRGWSQLLVCFTLAYSLSIIAFFVFSRFRMVIVPALYVFAAFALTELWRRWREALGRQAGYAPAVTVTALLLALGIFVNVPVRAHTDSWGYRLAATVGLPTRMADSSQGRFNLAVSYARLAKQADDPGPLLALAESELRKAIGPDEEHAKKHVELGKVLARQERNREAIEVYAQAAKIEPSDYKIHHALGLLHQRVGDLDSAEADFRRALGIASRHTASAAKLGEVLLATGRKAEAARMFRYALELSPGNPAALAGLRATQ